MARKRIFLDTSALVAYLREGDSCHKQAVAIWDNLRDSQSDLILTNYIMAEFLTVVRQRIGVKAAIEAGNLIKESLLFTIIQADQGLDNRAWEIFKANKDKNISFVDCVSFALMKKLKINDAFAFDKHFSKAGFTLLK